MAIVVLVLWLFTAGAGFRLLLTSSLGRARPAGPPARSPQPAPAPQPAGLSRPQPARRPRLGRRPAARGPAAAPRARGRRAARDRWAPPSLVAARQAPILPSTRSLVEFAHPAGGIIGLGFWLGFTLIHNRALGWIAFGLIAATACVGLGWFTANTRAARRAGPGRGSRAHGARRPSPAASSRCTAAPPPSPSRWPRSPPSSSGAEPGTAAARARRWPVPAAPTRIGGDERSLSPGAFAMIEAH